MFWLPGSGSVWGLRDATSPQRRRDKRRVQCHGGPPWWNGMGNLEECPQEWGHGSLKGYATVLRRRINELRRSFRREERGERRGQASSCLLYTSPSPRD